METVSMLWIGDRLSTLERLSITSYLCQGYRVSLYVYDPVDAVPAGVTLLDAREILPRESVFTYQRGAGRGSVAAFANLFRYKLLYERGGIWSDTDIVCLHRFDLADRPLVFASERVEEPEGPKSSPERILWRMRYHLFPAATATNCFMKAPAGSPVMEACYREAAAANPAELSWGDTGPSLLQRVISRAGLQSQLLPPEVCCPVDWWSVDALVSRPFKVPRRTIAIHLWNEMWRRSGLDKDARYPPDCLYERLKRLFGVDRDDRLVAAG